MNEEITKRLGGRMITVYIKEAHAVDEWPIGSRFEYKQPTTLADRARIAREFVQATDYKIPMYLDVPERGDRFDHHFAPWPIRYYIFQGDRLVFIAVPDQARYSLEEVMIKARSLV